MSKLIHTKFNQTNISPHINNYSTRGIIHDTRNISNDPTCRRVKKSFLALLAVLGSCSLSCGTLATVVGSAHAVGTEVDFNVTIPNTPVLEIILKDGAGDDISSGTGMTVTPTMAYAGFNTTGVNVTVGTSSTAGYNLKMLIDNSSKVSENNLSGINTNALVSSEGNTIETLDVNPDTPFTCTTATATTCNFTVNSWGYRLSTDAENTYKAIPAAETELVNYTDGATNGITTSLDFGVRANAKQPGGDYSTTLNFIATANAEQLTIDSLTYMQDFAMLSVEEYTAVLGSMTEGQSYQLTDSRDGTVYNVGKLNGKIWMLDNLALGGSSAMTLDSTNTNLADNTTYILPASGTVCFASDDCTGTAGSNNTDTTTTKTGTGYTIAAINADYKTTTSANNTDFTYNSNGDVSKAGVYYNYCAASAGTICAASGSNNNNAQYDICPKGWRLPTGGSDTNTSEFRALANNLGNVTSGNLTDTAYTDFKAAFHAGLSGYFYNGSVQSQTSYVHFWSSTRYNGSSMYDLYLDTTTVNPQYGYNRYFGLSVRCVLKGASTSITFNGNGADSGETTTLSLEAGSATLPIPETAGFANPRHAFLGWNTKADGSGTSYTAGTTITAEMNGLTLYAQWQEVTLAMQDADSTSLGNLLTNNGDITYLYDGRDDNVYTIGKLNDKYWMLDNLRLGGSSAMTLTGENTNLATTSSTYTLPASGNVCFANGDCTGTDGTTTGTGYTVAAINADYKTTTSAYGTNFTYNSNGDVSKAGVYYNYCAASAGTYCYARDAGTGNASYDICPKGWRLPTSGGDSGEFKALTNNLVGETREFSDATKIATLKAAFHAGLSGRFYDGSVQSQAGAAYFWSSTRFSGTDMCRLFIGTTNVIPQNSVYRFYGQSVRCVYGG